MHLLVAKICSCKNGNFWLHKGIFFAKQSNKCLYLCLTVIASDDITHNPQSCSNHTLMIMPGCKKKSLSFGWIIDKTTGLTKNVGVMW